MLIDYRLGQAGIVLRVKLRNAATPAGSGLKALTGASAGLIISTLADAEATATPYTATAAAIDTIATLGTFTAPAAGHCRFAEVDPTNHPGLYEVQLDNARFAVAGSRSLVVSFSGAASLAECDVCIPLRGVDPYSAGFGLVLDQGALDGITVLAAGAGPQQPAVNARQALGFGLMPAVGDWDGETGLTPATLTVNHPYTGVGLASFDVDQYGNRSNLQILVQPS